jgi:hypothetical protein
MKLHRLVEHDGLLILQSLLFHKHRKYLINYNLLSKIIGYE